MPGSELSVKEQELNYFSDNVGHNSEDRWRQLGEDFVNAKAGGDHTECSVAAKLQDGDLCMLECEFLGCPYK